MKQGIRFKVSRETPPDALHLLEMFVETWLDNDCIDPVRLKRWDDPTTLETVYEVCTESSEDELWLRLRGVPTTLGDYITLH